MRERLFVAVLLVLLALGACSPAVTPAPLPTAIPTLTPAVTPLATATAIPSSAARNADMILATTTSTQDSGLLDVLIPVFEKQTGYKVKPIVVGSGQAMTMGERGEADVLLVHAPDSEVSFMAAGHGVDRKLVMHNDFVLVGPQVDPAKIKGMTSAQEAMTKVASSRSLFISRGDNSGTDQLEKKLSKAAGIDPKGQQWYQETGQGMGLTLNVASDKAAYTIADRGTYLATKKNLALSILVEGDKSLLNIYHVIVVNPSKSSRINNEGAKAFAAFVVASETQKIIAGFGVERFGQPLFFPDAGKPEY